jgi:cytochrome c oxidase subunit 2
LSRRTILIALLTALALALTATPAFGIQLGPEDPHSPNADAIESTYWVTIVIVFALIIAVNAALIAGVVRFRDRRGREAARFTAGRGALRPAIAGFAVLALAIFVFGVIETANVRDVEPSGDTGLNANETAQVGISGLPPTNALEGTESAEGGEPISGSEPSEGAPLEIDAIAQQWLWRFEYPGGQPGQRTFSYGELVVPVDTAVVLNVSAIDVVHTWWVPALGGQVQAVPGEVTQTWFKADEVGRYSGRSTVFSGTSFPAMRSWVRVVTVPEYQQYVEQLKRDLTGAQDIIRQAQQEEQGSP